MEEAKPVLTLKEVLQKRLPAAGEEILAQIEGDIREFFGEHMGYKLQWRTKLIEAVHPEDKDLPRDQQRILFRFEIRAGEFLNPDIQITDFQVKYREFKPEEKPIKGGVNNDKSASL